MIFPHFKSGRIRALLWGAAFALAAISAPSARAQSGLSRELPDQASEDIVKLGPLIEAKNWNAALAMIDKDLPTFESKSFAFALFNQVKAQVLLQRGNPPSKEDYHAAIAALENATAVDGFFDENATGQMIYFLAQLYGQENNNQKAEVYIKRYLDRLKKPNPEADLFYISMLYNRAVADPKNIDMQVMKLCENEAHKGLLLTSRPKENFYILLLACLQQQGRTAETADIFELLVNQYPQKKDYWSQLAAAYLSLAGNEKDEEKALQYNLRAILTIERAQALGFMATPKDNFNLVGIYFNIQQFYRATELLEAGLEKGTIENVQKNWELLASSYQQIHKTDKAIAALRKATTYFPKSGQLDFQISNIYYSLDKTEEALAAALASAAKGGGDKPQRTYLYLAYLAFERKQLDVASDAVEKAAQFPGDEKEVAQVRQAVKDALTAREIARNKKL